MTESNLFTGGEQFFNSLIFNLKSMTSLLPLRQQLLHLKLGCGKAFRFATRLRVPRGLRWCLSTVLVHLGATGARICRRWLLIVAVMRSTSSVLAVLLNPRPSLKLTILLKLGDS